MTFLDEDLYEAVQNYLPKVNEYVSSHGGSIEFLGIKDGKVYIKLAGTCSGCSMSLMTTKMVVEKKLRELIHPQLTVINVDGSAENEPPQDIYTPKTQEKQQEDYTEKHSMMDNLKSAIGLN